MKCPTVQNCQNITNPSSSSHEEQLVAKRLTLLLVVLLVANRIIFEQIRAKSMNGLSSRVLVNISPGAGYDSIKPAPLDRSPVRYCASHLTIKHQSFNSRKIESTLRSDSEWVLTRGRWKRRRYGDVQSLFESSCRQ